MFSEQNVGRNYLRWYWLTLIVDRNDKVKSVVLESLSSGSTVDAACRAAGISRSVFYDWRKKDAEFAEAVERAQMVAVSVVEDALFLKATRGEKDGRGNVVAMIFWLCNRAPDRWKNVQRVEHSGEIKHTEEKEAERLHREIVEMLSGTDSALDKANEILNESDKSA